MTTITEDYVSFEIAKLLKERCFDEPCYAYWHEDENRLIISQSMHAIQNITNPCFFGSAAPTLQMAMKWLREVHKLSIEPYYDIVLSWAVDIKYIGKYTNYKEFEEVRSQTYNSYEEACEAAIKYCIEKLI